MKGEAMPEQTLVRPRSKSHTIVYVAAAIACMAVTAWVTIPIGPVPLSLAPLAIYFTLFAFSPKNAFAAIAGYILLGALGLPVFTGFRGGMGAVLGPTGGFIVGDVVAAAIALALGKALSKRTSSATDRPITVMGSIVHKRFFLRCLLMGVVFLVVQHAFGCAWLMIAGNLSIGAAFLAASAPFIVPDLLKIVLAIFLAQAVGATRRRS